MMHGRRFSVNATLETESNLYQLSYLSLPIHTSVNAAQAGGRVHLDAYNIYLSLSNLCNSTYNRNTEIYLVLQ
jgi:hypothetical protein